MPDLVPGREKMTLPLILISKALGQVRIRPKACVTDDNDTTRAIRATGDDAPPLDGLDGERWHWRWWLHTAGMPAAAAAAAAIAVLRAFVVVAPERHAYTS